MSLHELIQLNDSWTVAKYTGGILSILIGLIQLPRVLPDIDSRRRIFIIFIGIFIFWTISVFMLNRNITLEYALVCGFISMLLISIILDKSKHFTMATSLAMDYTARPFQFFEKIGFYYSVLLLALLVYPIVYIFLLIQNYFLYIK